MQKTVDTPYGETTIEVVECDSCGNTVSKNDTVEFTLGDRTGRACEHCYDNGPISFPERVTEWALPSDEINGTSHGLLFHIALYPLDAPIEIVAGFTGDDEFAQGYATGIISTLVWVGIAIGIYAAL